MKQAGQHLGLANNHFLSGGASYASSRPTYPPALADALAKWCSETTHALDVGCGNGQLSTLLAARFDKVTATDPSETQLQSAARHPSVTYRAEPAERIGIEANSVDLITAAQAAHWFDLDAFYREVRRVAKPRAVLALISYGVPVLDGEIGTRFQQFYWQDVHQYWPEGRQHVEDGYRSLDFPFEELWLPDLSISQDWSLANLIAYICTWSASRRALKAGRGDIVDKFIRDLGLIWTEPEGQQKVTWPIVGRLAVI
ncbi:class I SAM-dependent methyltransferase [uncultured Roseobacter sp.]|uniref:class I SAM-dependent methyltransferase n=1 Tax=uncultured Roseobacter sp. TaxID=114847 RepID=UPI00260BD300|nr:class I SAM-dependent methyltransferase [uncultured Roseobacter sp.]